MRFSPTFVPFAIFFVFFLILAYRTLRFASKIKANVTDGTLGKEIHLQTPFGSVDLKPQQGADSDLLGIPKYPGAVAVRELTSSAYEADFHLTGHDGHYVAETYRTDDEAGMVLDFYLRELPDWHQDQHYQHGYRLIREDAGSQKAITIQRFAGRTSIQYAVVHQNQPANNAGTTFNSDSSFGVLR